MTVKAANLQPIGDRVVIKPLPQEDKTKGGVILPETAKEKPIRGEVIAVGTGRILESGQKIPMEVKAGDKVLYGKYSGTEVKIGGEEYVVLSEKEILGILK